MPLSARDISVDSFDYSLPEDRIARFPASSRGGAKQLVYHASSGLIREQNFRDLPDCLPAGTLIVGNNTRVIHARLHFPLPNGGRPIEVFCLDPIAPADHTRNLGARTQVQWKVLIGGNRRWKKGPLELVAPLGRGEVRLRVERISRQEQAFTVAFTWFSADAELTFGEVLEAAGTLPLPPYLGRATEAEDEERYQTVFAKTEGSVAAPTAGLHFTPEVMQRLRAGRIEWREVLLHVGAGTFRPVASPTLGGHPMHKESFSVSHELVRRLAEQYLNGRPVVAVGTTTLRCLESLHVLGAQLLYGTRQFTGHDDYLVGQWALEDERTRGAPPAATFTELSKHMSAGGLTTLSGETEILLSPVSGVRTVNGLITNFHQPKSTLLLLIAAIVGDGWRKIYDYALKNDFRFLSYGDSSLLWR